MAPALRYGTVLALLTCLLALANRPTWAAPDCEDYVCFGQAVFETSEATGTAKLTILRDPEDDDVRQALTVEYLATSGSARRGEDFEGATGQVHFQAGETSKDFSIPILKDANQEGEEVFVVLVCDLDDCETALEDDFWAYDKTRVTIKGDDEAGSQPGPASGSAARPPAGVAPGATPGTNSGAPSIGTGTGAAGSSLDPSTAPTTQAQSEANPSARDNDAGNTFGGQMKTAALAGGGAIVAIAGAGLFFWLRAKRVDPLA